MPNASMLPTNELAIKGLEVRIDRREPMMHMKTMILDNKTLILGSYNFSAAAENRNVEILAVINSRETAAQATVNWKFHWNHAMPYKTLAKPNASTTQLANEFICNKYTCPLKPSRKFFRIRPRRTFQWF